MFKSLVPLLLALALLAPACGTAMHFATQTTDGVTYFSEDEPEYDAYTQSYRVMTPKGVVILKREDVSHISEVVSAEE